VSPLVKLLGIDPGKRWVGLASSDDTGTIATPLETIDRETVELSETLKSILNDEAINRIVVGYPEPLQAESNERTRQVDQFINEFVKPLDVPFNTVSERYTTKEARRLRSKRGQSPSEAADAEAAAVILQYFLDCSNKQEGPSQDLP